MNTVQLSFLFLGIELGEDFIEISVEVRNIGE